MRRLSNPTGRAVGVGAAALIVSLAIVAIATGAIAGDSKAKVKVKCPSGAGGSTMTCKVVGRLPRGPMGFQGSQGSKGEKGPMGPKGPMGGPGLSGYEVVSQLFEDVFIENSGGAQRGLSAAQIVNCPAGKRAIGGGSDLGTNATQNGAQRQVTVSLSGPNGTGTGWSVQLFNNAGFDAQIDLKVYAICASVS